MIRGVANATIATPTQLVRQQIRRARSAATRTGLSSVPLETYRNILNG